MVEKRVDAEVSIERGPTRSSRVPTPALVIVIVIGLAATVTLFLGTRAVGVTWDERIHAVMLHEYFTSGWYASPDWLVNGSPSAKLGDWPYYVYAPVAALIQHVAEVLSGAASWGGFADDSAAYAARHVATAVMALLGAVGVAGCLRLITRSWRWGIVGAVTLLAVPMWTGHGMFNGKDLPVGVGYTLVSLALVSVLTRDYGKRIGGRVLVYVALIAGVLLSVGTRPASGLPMALTAGVMVLVGALAWLAARRRAALLPRLGARVVDVTLGGIASYLALVAIYPKGFINPYTLAHETLAISGRFPVSDPVLTNGVWLQQPVPWSYLPIWFGAQLPVLVLVLVLVFGGFWLVGLVMTLRSRTALSTWWDGLVLPLPVVAQALLLPLLAIAFHSTMYNAVRQFLFVVPAVVILAVLGLRHLLRVAGASKAWVIAIWALTILGLVAPVVDQVKLFPYGYVFLNRIATLQPVDGRWSTDYWRASTPELAGILPATGAESCQYVASLDALKPCAEESTFEPFWSLRGTGATPGTLGPSEYWLVRENVGRVAPPPGCTLHDSVTRTLHGQTISIGQVLKCNVDGYVAPER